MQRRSFISMLASLPFLKIFPQDYDLPVSCDLTMRAFTWAIEYGKQKGLGKPLFLKIGPENIFPAREILGWTPDRIDPESRWILAGMMVYRVAYNLPKNSWMIVFENGTVKSEAL